MGPFIHQIANWRRTRQTLTKYLGCIPASKWIITINMVHNYSTEWGPRIHEFRRLDLSWPTQGLGLAHQAFIHLLEASREYMNGVDWVDKPSNPTNHKRYKRFFQLEVLKSIYLP
jgi:hypothetical protein